MKKNKIVSLIFVCAFLVLTFCCSFAGKIVDVEVKPPLRAVGPLPSSFEDIYFKVDLDSVSADNFWDDGYSYSFGYFNFGYVTSFLSVFDSTGELIFSDSVSMCQAGLRADSTLPGVVSLHIYKSDALKYTFTSGVYYIRYDSMPSNYPLYFNLNNSFKVMSSSTVPVNSVFLTVVDSITDSDPILPAFSPELFFDNLMLGITGTADELGLLFSNLGANLFITVVDGVNQLSVFGTVVAIMLGVSIILGLCNIVLDYILTLGRKKR